MKTKLERKCPNCRARYLFDHGEFIECAVCRERWKSGATRLIRIPSYTDA